MELRYDMQFGLSELKLSFKIARTQLILFSGSHDFLIIVLNRQISQRQDWSKRQFEEFDGTKILLDILIK